jgi:hypothetical protein
MTRARWDRRLISAERAINLAGDWTIRFTPLEDGTFHAICEQCGQSCGQFYKADALLETSPADLLSAVLRHMVMAHDVPLNKPAQEAAAHAG